MANYYCSTRTNYFHVNDPDSFREFMAHVEGCEEDVQLWEEKDAEGNPVFGFGCDGNIFGYVEHNLPVDCDPAFNGDVTIDDEGLDEDDGPDYDVCYSAFVKGLQEHVADNDAVIIFESGHEKLRYVVGSAVIITKTDVEYVNIEDAAIAQARQMLNNDSFTTQCDY